MQNWSRGLANQAGEALLARTCRQRRELFQHARDTLPNIEARVLRMYELNQMDYRAIYEEYRKVFYNS